MTTPIGFIIQPGQSIPDDVTQVADREGDAWYRTSRGHWHTDVTNADSCSNNPTCWDATGTLMNFGPLTVTAVREQPAEPEPACWKCGLGIGEIVDRGVNSFADGRLRFMHAYGECPTADQLVQHAAELGIAEPLNINGLIRDSREIMAILGVSEAADVLPELKRRLAPQPVADPVPDVLDLVRQYAQKRVAAAVLRLDSSDEAAELRAEEHAELWCRIEAEVQRLRVEADATGFLAAVNKLTIERDDARAELKHHLESVDRLAGERNEAVAEVERWRERVLDLLPDPTAPLVLSLPQVPEGDDPGNVRRAIAELAVLRGLLNKRLADLEVGVILRTIDDIRSLLVAEVFDDKDGTR